MPGGIMPYIEEKGPYFSVVESILSSYAKRKSLLLKLREQDGAGNYVNDLVDLAGLESQNLNVPPYGNAATRKAIVNRDWFGRPNPVPGQPTTGFWVGWNGDAEGILREALIRTIEVSWGIAHDANPPAASASMCPIDIYWICQGPFFQCWIDWRKTQPTNGHVVLVITTPPPYQHPINWRITRDFPEAGWAEYASDPAPGTRSATDQARALDPNVHQGMWVVGHPDYEQRTFTPTARGAKGDALNQTVYFAPKNNDDSVCVVSPAEREGGVLANGRPY